MFVASTWNNIFSMDVFLNKIERKWICGMNDIGKIQSNTVALVSLFLYWTLTVKIKWWCFGDKQLLNSKSD